ncbi:MAG: FlgD immunoglobulin-like domain containing protein [Acidobacteriota bacterium]
MKRLLLSAVLAGLMLCANAAMGQIANPGFEAWTNNQPDGWFTYQSIFNDVVKSSVAHSGSSALKASVVIFNNTPTGSLVQSGAGAQGFPVNARHGSVSGWYQFTGVAGDQFNVAVLMYTGSGSNLTLIGAGEFATSTSTGSTWAKFTAPITYISPQVPSIVTIHMIVDSAPDSSDPHVGSFYIVDDLTLDAVTAVGDQGASAPAAFALEQNFPNPFNPSTTIRYSLPKESNVTLSVYNMLGEEVKTLVSGVRASGTHEVVWNGDTNAGVPAGSGLYVYRLRAGSLTEVRRMMLVK